ncbi:alpha/beta hydrolase family protein [Streptomyces sp. NPDC057939]|uniref:alpha/beta hydrolase family protein n=1 Tax=Streptomyces sp. NPDC057939 TaxID=3346284 RepID=UPI0036F0D254
MPSTGFVHSPRSYALATLCAAVLALAPAADTARAGAAAGPPGPTRTVGPRLPAPTGGLPVGLRTLALRDTSREDPWEPGRARELMLSVWYPALPSEAPRAAYVTARESAMILRQHRVTGVPEDLLSRTRTHARTGPPALPVAGSGLPLVLLSPGFSLPRTSLTALAEDLASRGYAVAAVDHAYESAAITYPDGRVTGCSACRPAVRGAEVAATRAADLSYVRRRLTGAGGGVEAGGGVDVGRGGEAGLPRLDPARVAVVGHSIGGAAAFEAMRRDPAFVAGVNMDGTFQPSDAGPLERPFLLLGADRHGLPGADPSWDAAWRRLTGPRAWFSAAGAVHTSFTDYAALTGATVPAAAGGGPAAPALPAARAVRLTRELVAAFLDGHLRDGSRPRADALLDAVRARHPQLRGHGR